MGRCHCKEICNASNERIQIRSDQPVPIDAQSESLAESPSKETGHDRRPSKKIPSKESPERRRSKEIPTQHEGRRRSKGDSTRKSSKENLEQSSKDDQPEKSAERRVSKTDPGRGRSGSSSEGSVVILSHADSRQSTKDEYPANGKSPSREQSPAKARSQSKEGPESPGGPSQEANLFQRRMGGKKLEVETNLPLQRKGSGSVERIPPKV